MHDVLPLLVKSMIVKSVPAAAPPLPSEIRKFEDAQAAVPAGAALVCGPDAVPAGVVAWLGALPAAVAAAEEPELAAEAGPVG